jgi:uncharacterized ferritin-like protein (DUF455 family)
MLTSANKYLPGDNARAVRMRMDTASILKRFFFCVRSLVVSQAGWIPSIALFEIKVMLPRFIWEDAMTANAIRDRIFELRYPSRLLEVGSDAALIKVFDEALNAPSAEAFVFALGHVLKPAMATVYLDYLSEADEIADGPTRRFLRHAVDELDIQIKLLQSYADEMMTANSEQRPVAEAWASGLQRALTQVGFPSLDVPGDSNKTTKLPGYRAFKLAEVPARDSHFRLVRFYWPDIVEADFPYGEGLRLQLRSAISHFNEVWAVETGGAILYSFAESLGWEFILDAARWTYDESRHVRMGYERLKQWGFEPEEIPLGSYIYDSVRGQSPVYRLGMLSYFETKNIGKKRQRAEVFARYGDHVSQHDMDFDWADETIHAHYGSHWLNELHRSQPDRIPEPEAVRAFCDQLVAAEVATATDEDRRVIRTLAQAMITKAEQNALPYQG